MTIQNDNTKDEIWAQWTSVKYEFQGCFASICFGGLKLKVGTLELGAWVWTCLHVYDVYFGFSWGNSHTWNIIWEPMDIDVLF